MSVDLPSVDFCLMALVSSGALKLEPIEPEFKNKEGRALIYNPELEVISRNVSLLAEVRIHLIQLLDQMKEDQNRPVQP